jgi:biopolymer transport protein ExbB/TolQ
MDSTMTMFTGILGLVIALFLLVLAVLWFCLPFAVFGLKDRISRLEGQLRASNQTIELLSQNTANLVEYARRADQRAHDAGGAPR